ncbi:MAG: replicative DNA helicase [Chloroflexota bacterium]|nr:replicative DNA helicase [Chloroflexota bacterium]
MTLSSHSKKIVPHNHEAEESVLGSVLIHPDVYYELVQFLRSDDFYIHRHRWIWEAFVHLSEGHTPVDYLTLTDELDQQGKLEEIGGAAYITSLLNIVPSALNAVAYGHIVEETATRRRMLAAANKIAQLAYRQDEPVDGVLDDAVKVVHDVGDRLNARELTPFSQVMDNLYDHVDEAAKAQKRGELIGVPTGFIDLDKLLGGLQPADLVIVASRPGIGKTSFLLSIAKNAAMRERPKHVAIFSLEMPNYQLGLRILAQETGLNTQRVRNGKLNQNEWERFIQAADVFSQAAIFSDDTPSISPLQMLAKARRLHIQHPLDLIIVDYLQLMSGGRRFNNRVEEVSYISRQLKLIAKELNIPVVAAAQLSRAVEQRADKCPLLSDLRESGALEQDADVVMFLYKPEDADGETTNVVVAKHRNGPLGVVPLIFHAKQAKFVNAYRGN